MQNWVFLLSLHWVPHGIPTWTSRTIWNSSRIGPLSTSLSAGDELSWILPKASTATLGCSEVLIKLSKDSGCLMLERKHTGSVRSVLTLRLRAVSGKLSRKKSQDAGSEL